MSTLANYIALIKTNPNREMWEVYSDSNGNIITNSSSVRLRNEVLGKYGENEMLIVRKVNFITYPPDRVIN